ncbi:MAG: hypothetical protein AAF242_08390, partial [Bacteroidota bacterium]
MSVLANYTPLAYFFEFSSNTQDAKQKALRQVVDQLQKSTGQDFDFFYDIGLTKYKTSKSDNDFVMEGELIIFRSFKFGLFKGTELVLFPPDPKDPSGVSKVAFHFSSPLSSMFGDDSGN